MEFRCKNCGSKNLEIEEKGNQTGLYCCDCGKWLKWITKEEKRVFNNKNGCTPFYIPEGATNGDMIKAMFPNCEQKEHMNNGYFEMYFDNDLKNASYMRVSKDWWRAPYKKEVEE